LLAGAFFARRPSTDLCFRLSQIPPVGALVTPPNKAPLCRVGGLGAPPRRGRCHDGGLVFFWGSAYFFYMPSTFDFCLPTRSTIVPHSSDWLHEVKYDGYRLRLDRDGDRVRLITRGAIREQR